MISNLTLFACLVSLFISLFLPVIVISVFAYQSKKQKLISAWALGAAGFFVTQMVIRLPILMVLQSQPWFAAFSENHLFLYAFSLAFTAGLFELAGRFAVAKLLSKNLNYRRALAAGLGHGGIEAMILVGITYLNNILYIFMINHGTFDAVVAQAAQTGVDVSALIQLKDTLVHSSPALFLLGGYERILAMVSHAAMSLIVCYGVHVGKPLKGALVCLGLHTFLDLTAGINMLSGTYLSQSAAYVIIYAILTAVAVVSILLILKIRRNWRKSEVNHV